MQQNKWAERTREFNTTFGTQYLDYKDLLEKELRKRVGIRYQLANNLGTNPVTLKAHALKYGLGHLLNTRAGRGPILWEDVLCRYNRANGTAYKTVEQLLTELYHQTGSLESVSHKVFVGIPYISAKLKSFGIAVVPRHQRKGNAYAAIESLPDKTAKKMSSAEIAEMAGCTRAHARRLLQEMNKPYQQYKISKKKRYARYCDDVTNEHSIGR